MTASLVVGVDVGGTTIKTGLVDRHAGLTAGWRGRTPVSSGPEAVCDAVLAGVEDAVDRAPAGQVAAVGVVVPGIIDEQGGIARSAANLGWTDVPLRKLVAERVGLPAVLGHDVRAAALAEGRLGAASGADAYLFMALGTGIGAAVVLGGGTYVGTHGRAGEFGHTCVDPAGPRCACGGRGCIETFAAGPAIASAYARRAGLTGPVDAVQVSRQAAVGDPVAGEVWARAIRALAIGIANYVTLLDPQLIVIGGGVATAGERLFTPLRAALRETLPDFVPPPPVLAAQLKEAGILGAAMLAWSAIGVQLGGRGPVSQRWPEPGR
jgi:glucokinase